MFVEWFSQKMVGPLFIFSFDSSTVRAGGKHKYQRSDSGTKHLQGGDHMPRVRKTTRQFEKDKAAFFAQCKARHAVCWLCGMPIDYAAEKNTSDESYNLDHLYPVSNTKNSSSTQQASAQATPAVTDSEATKTHQHPSEHSQDNG